MKWSKYQKDIFSEIETGKGNIAVKAVAGSGKTTTAIEAVSLMKGSVTMLAFNRDIAKVMGQKLSERKLTHAKAFTFHGLGYSTLRYAWRNGPEMVVAEETKSGDTKWERIVSELGIPEYLVRFTYLLCAHAKKRALGILEPIHSREAWIKICDHHDLYSDINNEAVVRAKSTFSQAVELGLEFAKAALLRSNEISEEEHFIDMDDMVYIPVLLPINFYRVDYVVVDESQDSIPVWRCMIRKLVKPRGRSMWIGDPCQPAGTLISVPAGGQIGRGMPIESLTIGDKVVSLARRDSAFVQNGRVVSGITKRQYDGHLVVVTSNGKTTQYTPNHYCYAKMQSIAHKYCVYLMRKNDCWRIGTSRMQNRGANGACGPISRKRVEQANDVYVLALFDTEREAKTYEFKLSTEHGIPELLFRAPSSEYQKVSQEAIDLAWACLDKARLGRAAYKVLVNHKRDIDYPLNEIASVPGNFWVTKPSKIRACNLMEGMSVLHYSNTSHYSKKDFGLISKIRSVEYRGPVYSLNVEQDHTYVADGIATFNCQAINGFAGADNDAFDLVIKEFNCKEMPLTVSYRSSKASVEFVKQWVPYIEAHENNLPGKIESMDWKTFLETKFNPETDAIICRNTAPLVQAAYSLVGKGIACQIRGRKDLGDGLIKLITKWKTPRSLQELGKKLDDYCSKQLASYEAAGKEMLAAGLSDKVNAIFAIMSNLPTRATIGDLIEAIESIFGDKEGDKKRLTLCTGHKSKGLEWDNIYWIGLDTFQPSKYARQQWQIDQELHLCYVMGTRNKDAMYLVEAPPRQDVTEENKESVLLEAN